MKLELKNWWTGEIIFEGDFSSIAELVKAAIKNKTNLSSANLSSANLSSANLRGADLSSADLRGANLSSANLSSANLSSANLRDADLSSANLRDADLSSADLSSANLSSANLSSANLRGADLSSADLRGANLSSAKNADYAIACTRILSEGDLIGWKKCVGEIIVKLRIPADAKRSHAFGRKCRAEYVEVLEVFGGKQGQSHFDTKIFYRKGETVKCDKWCDDFTEECAGGIHFFITRLEAENYNP